MDIRYLKNAKTWVKVSKAIRRVSISKPSLKLEVGLKINLTTRSNFIVMLGSFSSRLRSLIPKSYLVKL